MRRLLAGGAVIVVLAVGAGLAAATYEPAGPAGCATLLRQAEQVSDAGTLIEEAGCLDTPGAHDPTALP